MGNHELRHNVYCYMKDISCGKPCNKQLPGCNHKCIRTCHKNDCIDLTAAANENNNDETVTACMQPCQKERPHCTHICAAPCHSNTPCPDTVCQAMVTVKCKCGFKSKQIKCLQRMYDTGQVVFENLACEIKEMLSCRSIDVSTFKNTQMLKKKHE
jgi:transcriptional repressor NF-X1